MHDLAYADAARPMPVRILRLPLQTYAVGHELLLLNRRNALIALPPEEFNTLRATEQQRSIREAVIICARRAPRWLRSWLWAIRHDNYPLAAAEFRNYRAAGNAFPPVPTREAEIIASGTTEADSPEGRSLGSPYFARLMFFLLQHRIAEQLGFESPYDVPLAHANFLYFSAMESEGGLKVENPREAQIREEMAMHRAAVAAERAAAQKK